METPDLVLLIHTAPGACLSIAQRKLATALRDLDCVEKRGERRKVCEWTAETFLGDDTFDPNREIVIIGHLL